VLEAYRKHVEERAAEGVVPKPLDAGQTAELVELLKNPPAGEDATLLDLISNRVPPGVDEAAYVKAAFLTAVVKGEASSPLISRTKAIELLGMMLGGYNIETLVDTLEDAELGELAAEQLKHTLLMFDAFHDVEEKAKAGNALAKEVIQSKEEAYDNFELVLTDYYLKNKYHTVFQYELKITTTKDPCGRPNQKP